MRIRSARIWCGLVYENKYYLEVYLDNFDYKIVNTEMLDYLGDNLFEINED